MEIQIVPADSSSFPAQLAAIHQPPQQLYCRGQIELLQHPLLLAIVGSRKANSYGKQSLQHLLPPAIQRGVVTVSGLAFGIDALAHRHSLNAGKPTIAVLGSGVDDDSVYPRNHLKLAHDILQHGGLIISEHPPGTIARPYFFPIRNRIIAGLASATVIVQATIKSGSLVTARLALDEGRDVAVVPGPITDPLSFGPNMLLRQGAIPLTSPEDVYELLNLQANQTIPLPKMELTPIQQQVLTALAAEPKHIDTISEAAHLNPQATSIALVELELLDLAQHLGNSKYART